jgi:hypothetical protein
VDDRGGVRNVKIFLVMGNGVGHRQERTAGVCMLPEAEIGYVETRARDSSTLSTHGTSVAHTYLRSKDTGLDI